jgi:hypothetical protein
MRTHFALLVCAASLACAQGTAPKASASDYPVHTESGPVPLGAEYMLHSFGSGGQMYIIEDYLVVEVALFPAKDATLEVDPSHFSLHVNGKKAAIQPQPPTTAAVSLNHPDWQRQRPRTTTDVGAGGVDAGLGYPQNRPPFPGAPQPPPPNPPRAPEADPSSGVERTQKGTASDILMRTALPGGPHRGPVSGFLYFPYTGKPGSVKSLDLVWEGVVLKVR